MKEEIIRSIPDAFHLGIYVYLLNYPSGISITRKHLQEHFKVGQDKINKTLSWLNKNLLIEYIYEKNSNGRFRGNKIVVKI